VRAAPAFTPQPFHVLLGRALAELERERAIFDLPRRSFWRGREGLDLSVAVPGGRASNPAGPAAGPHTQLAQNLVIGWLAGARILELKTVQVRDRLEIPRPCIDAPNLGFNVEWSQELEIGQSIEQYVAGWTLIHVLKSLGVAGEGTRGATRFDVSVGYDLAGIRSASVAAFLDAMTDAGAHIERLRASLPPALRAHAAVEVPARIASCVTLSTFHGCPAEEIEHIAEHLFTRHGMHVVVKLNPTLLGYEAVDELLRGRLGYEEIRLDREAFDRDLKWDHAVALLDRLAGAAARAGVGLGVKFTNTLVVRNHRPVFHDEVVYLSGRPLHVIAMALAARFARATAGRHALSFSGGIDAENFHEAVACGMVPVTACTDLLAPPGYRRLPLYLKTLEAGMERLEARTIAEYIVARAEALAVHGPLSSPPDPGGVRAASLANLAAYAARLPNDPRYHAAQNRAAPRREASRLALFDCLSCNACVVVCPNDAFFSVRVAPGARETWDLEIQGGEVRKRPARFEIARDEQWAVYAGFCNECGNCDTFCPEHGGPSQAKPRFFGSRASFDAAAPGDGFLIEVAGGRMLARFRGALHELERREGGARFRDEAIEVELDRDHRVVVARARAPREGHVLPLWRYHAMAALRDAVLATVNPVSAAFLPAVAGEGGQGIG